MKLVLLIVAIYSATCWSLPARGASNNAEVPSIFDSHHAAHKESLREARIKAGLQQKAAETTDPAPCGNPCDEKPDSVPCGNPCRVTVDPAPCGSPCDVRPDPDPAPCRNPCPIKEIPVQMPFYPIGGSNSMISESEQYEQINTAPYQPIVVYPLGGSSSNLITADEYFKEISAQHPIILPIPPTWDGGSSKLISLEQYLSQFYAQQPFRPPAQPQLPCSANIINPPTDVQILPSGPCNSISNPCGGSGGPGSGSISPSRPCQLSASSNGGYGGHQGHWNSQFNDRYFGLGGVDSDFSGQLGSQKNFFGSQSNYFGSQISNDLSRYMSESVRLAREQAQNVQGSRIYSGTAVFDPSYVTNGANGKLQSHVPLSSAEGENHNVNEKSATTTHGGTVP